jgi:ATP-dependent DNA helicase PIF1
MLLWAGAGFGKGATCMKYLYPRLKHMYGSTGEVWISAPTGISAGLCNGSTIYSQSGIGTGAGSVKQLYDRIKRTPALATRWEKVLCITLDECSLLSLETYKKLEELARMLKGNDLFFGGIRVILIGDFCQLPPCNDVTELNNELVRMEAKYLFEDGELWLKGQYKVRTLNTIVLVCCRHDSR